MSTDFTHALQQGLRRQALISGIPSHPNMYDYLERSIIVLGLFPTLTPASWGWRCLTCLGGGRGDASTMDLAIAVHALDCAGNPLLAQERIALMTGLTAFCQDAGPAPWNTDVVTRALNSRGYWPSLAERLGWPVGVFAIEGWDLTLAAAQERAKDMRSIWKEWM